MTRLTRQWQDDHAALCERDLSDRDFLYVWADGVHPKVRLGQVHSCVLVLLGVRLDGTKELIALAEGLRESTESWADLLRDCRRRGMRDPELVVGDGAMGLWKALAEVFPTTRHQRCWVHRARSSSQRSLKPHRHTFFRAHSQPSRTDVCPDATPSACRSHDTSDKPLKGVNLTSHSNPHNSGFSSRHGGAAQWRHGYFIPS
ncbi:hypothetical protein GCM10022206_28560 [Streptomyces chiangmaiensis]